MTPLPSSSKNSGKLTQLLRPEKNLFNLLDKQDPLPLNLPLRNSFPKKERAINYSRRDTRQLSTENFFFFQKSFHLDIKSIEKKTIFFIASLLF